MLRIIDLVVASVQRPQGSGWHLLGKSGVYFRSDLIGQCLCRGNVNKNVSVAGLEDLLNRIKGYERFAGRRRSGDQHGLLCVDCIQNLALPLIWTEGNARIRL